VDHRLLRFWFSPLSGNSKRSRANSPLVKSVQTDNEVKLNPSLGWISEYHAPVIYQLWWREIADCEGLPLPLDSLRKVQYFQVNGPDFIPEGIDAIVYAVTFERTRRSLPIPLSGTNHW